MRSIYKTKLLKKGLNAFQNILDKKYVKETAQMKADLNVKSKLLKLPFLRWNFIVYQKKERYEKFYNLNRYLKTKY